MTNSFTTDIDARDAVATLTDTIMAMGPDVIPSLHARRHFAYNQALHFATSSIDELLAQELDDRHSVGMALRAINTIANLPDPDAPNAHGYYLACALFILIDKAQTIRPESQFDKESAKTLRALFTRYADINREEAHNVACRASIPYKKRKPRAAYGAVLGVIDDMAINLAPCHALK